MSSAALMAGRAAAERQMLDAGTAKRPTGGMTYDPNANGGTGGDVEAFADLFTSRCKVQARNLVARTSEVGERTATTMRLELHLPVATDALEVGDAFTVTAPDPQSIVPAGTTYRVTGLADGTAKTARRYEVERVVS